MKSWEHEFVIRDFKLGPSKLLFALNNGMFGMIHECLTDTDHLIYDGKFVYLEDTQDCPDEFVTTYYVMGKSKDGTWKVLRKFD